MTSSFKEDITIAEYLGGSLTKRKKQQLEKQMVTSNQFLDEMLTIHTILHDEMIDQWETVSISNNDCKTLLSKLNAMHHKKLFPWTIKKQNYLKWLWSLLSDLNWTVGRFLFSSPQLQTIPVVRSNPIDHEAKNCIVIKKIFDDVHTVIEMLNRGDGYIDMMVSVTNATPKKNAIRVCLIHEQGAITSQLINREALINKQPFGKYNLILDAYGIEKGVFSFEINEDGMYEH